MKLQARSTPHSYLWSPHAKLGFTLLPRCRERRTLHHHCFYAITTKVSFEPVKRYSSERSRYPNFLFSYLSAKYIQINGSRTVLTRKHTRAVMRSQVDDESAAQRSTEGTSNGTTLTGIYTKSIFTRAPHGCRHSPAFMLRVG